MNQKSKKIRLALDIIRFALMVAIPLITLYFCINGVINNTISLVRAFLIELIVVLLVTKLPEYVFKLLLKNIFKTSRSFFENKDYLGAIEYLKNKEKNNYFDYDGGKEEILLYLLGFSCIVINDLESATYYFKSINVEKKIGKNRFKPSIFCVYTLFYLTTIYKYTNNEELFNFYLKMYNDRIPNIIKDYPKIKESEINPVEMLNEYGEILNIIANNETFDSSKFDSKLAIFQVPYIRKMLRMD